MSSSSSITSKLSRSEVAVGVTAALALLALLIPWYHITYAIGGQSFSAWDTGYGWMADLLVAGAGIYVVASRVRPDGVALRLRPAMAVLGVTALGTLLVVIRLGSLPRAGSQSFAGVTLESHGPSAGIVLALFAGIVQCVVASLIVRGALRAPTVSESSVLPEPSDV